MPVRAKTNISAFAFRKVKKQFAGLNIPQARITMRESRDCAAVGRELKTFHIAFAATFRAYLSAPFSTLNIPKFHPTLLLDRQQRGAVGTETGSINALVIRDVRFEPSIHCIP